LSCGFFGSCIRSYGSSSLKYQNCGFLGSSIHLIWIPFSQILELWVFGINHSFHMDSLLTNPWIVGFWDQPFISYGFSSLKSLNCGFFGFKHSFHMDSLLSNPWIVLLVGVLLKCCNS
jgi:hypothetical protein